jgi:integrase
MNEKLRYVTARRSAKGKLRWYWQRRGYPLTRLPDDRVVRIAMADRLNAAADGERGTDPEPGSVGTIVAEYRDSDAYRDLARNTARNYEPFLRDILALGARLPFSAFTRRVVVDHVEAYARPDQRRLCATVLKNLFRIAQYRGLIASDPTVGLRLKSSKPRDRVWSDEEISRWLDAARIEDPHMTTGFVLLQYSAQRPNDVLHMTWPQYSGSAIRLRQMKTGALLEVPTHPVLTAHLDSLQRSSTSLTIVAYRGRPVHYSDFNKRFRRIAERAGIEGAQARDLRRTAMLRMAEAGATTPMIASVSGHSITATQRILETYLPRNRALAEIAITRLAEYKKRTGV